MKIIDLLNKIANGEEVPKKIKYDNVIYVYVRMWEQYVNEETEKPLLKEISAYNYSGLNNEVEILDDEDEERGLPEKIKITEKSITVKGTTFFRDKDIEIFQKLSMQINEIIDYLKNQSKGD